MSVYDTEANSERTEGEDLTPSQREVMDFLRGAETTTTPTPAPTPAEEEDDDRPTMDPAEYAALAAYGKALEAKAAKIKAALKKMRPADAPEGEPVPVVLPDGSEVGAVHLRKGYTKYAVKDKAAFLDHVSRTHPDQVVFSVESKFQKHLLGVARHQVVPGVGTTTINPTYEVDIPEHAYEEILSYASENPDFGAIINT